MAGQEVLSAERWRQKYYESLNELEGRERRWEEVETLLRRSISRLTLLGDGVDAALDRQLETLRNTIRQEQDTARIRQMVDAIADAAAKVEAARRRARQGAEGPDVHAVLAELCTGLAFPRRLARRARGLQRRLQAGKDPIDALVPELGALLADAVGDDAAREDDGEARGGLLNRMRRGAAPAPAADTPPDDVASAEEVLTTLLDALNVPAELAARVDGLRRRLASARQADELQAVAAAAARILSDGVGREAPAAGPAAHDLLRELLDRMSLPKELDARVASVRRGLDAPLADAEVPRRLQAIADLVADLRSKAQSERREIEQFLAQLSEKLHELDVNLQGADSDRAESYASAVELHDAMREQVSGIALSVRDAADLDTLKSSVQDRLDAIHTHMEKHRAAEEQRNRSAEERIQKLTERLSNLERESDDLRKSVQRAREHALRDPLTGIPNRMAYEERMAQEFVRWKRYGSPLTLVLWDLDHFKQINDSYGHKAGDKVLRAVGRIFASALRASDFTARYGGEEFVSLLPESGLDAALKVADKVREAVADCGFHHGGESVRVTLSCGLAAFGAEDTVESVFDRADRALYHAKEAGRNQCVTLDPAAATPARAADGT